MTLFNYSAVTKQLLILAKWLALASLVGLLAGAASALFLFSLDWVTHWREAYGAIIWLLPLAGFAVGWIYLKFGSGVEAGNNLLIDEIHDPQQVVPLRMAPLVLGGTLVSHLFGASVGREGTAVQMGGALADQLTHICRLRPADRRVLLMAGIAAGFASVFGTPLAGALFALEVLAIGRLRSDAIFPCIIAAVVADRFGLWLGVQHTHYAIAAIPPIALWGICATLLAGVIFGLVGMLFANATHALSSWVKSRIAYAPWRPFLGGIVVALAVWALGSQRYIGLGIPTILEAFQQPPRWHLPSPRSAAVSKAAK